MLNKNIIGLMNRKVNAKRCPLARAFLCNCYTCILSICSLANNSCGIYLLHYRVVHKCENRSLFGLNFVRSLPICKIISLLERLTRGQRHLAKAAPNDPAHMARGVRCIHRRRFKLRDRGVLNVYALYKSTYSLTHRQTDRHRENR